MTVREWIHECEITGHSTFSFAEIGSALPSYSKSVLSSELSRLVSLGVITSVHRGFYVTIPTRYKKTGVVPPLYYIDSMFKYLRKPYYVSLLSAAQFFGAAHQKPQIDFVTTILPRMNTSRAKNPCLRWIYRRQIPNDLILEKNGEGGVIRYSSAELTALDLVQYGHLVGGLSSVATVLSELAESVDFSAIDISALLAVSTVRTVQRIGYLLDEILDEKLKADALLGVLKSSAVRMEWIALSPLSKNPASQVCSKWKIRINETVEPDEL